MTRVAGFLLVVGLLALSLSGCDDFFQFHPPDGSDGNSGEDFPGQAMFFDNFEGGAKSAWTAASGTWRAEGGLYSVEETRVLNWFSTYVKTSGSKQWDNYAVNVDLRNAEWFEGFNEQTAAIILRAQDDLNKVLFKVEGDSLFWEVRVNGDRKSASDVVSPGLTTRSHIRVEVEGDTYTAYVRQGQEGGLVKRTSFKDDTFSNGMPGLAIYRKISLDFNNFRVSRLD